MKSEADELKLRKRMDNLHKNIDIMKGDKFRLTNIVDISIIFIISK